jgi:hypothetical protein
MAVIINKQGSNLILLGYSFKREYFGGSAIAFRQVENYDYEYNILDLSGFAGLSSGIEGTISGLLPVFSGDVTIRSLSIPAAHDLPDDQIRVGRYNFSVEVRKSIGSGDSNYYQGLGAITQTGYSGLNNFSENFSFENTDDYQRFNHQINFELRTGDRSFAQSLASGLFVTSEPGTLGVGVLSGYLGAYADANTTNYYTETYDSFKNTYSFQKTKSLYKLSGQNYTYQLDTKVEYADSIVTVVDDIKVKGKQSFAQASAGLAIVTGTSLVRAQDVYGAYKSFDSVTNNGTLFTTPLKTVVKYDIQALTADATLTYTDNPLYKNNFKQDQTITLSKDVNGIVRLNNQYNFTLIRNITGDMDALYSPYFQAQTSTSDSDVNGYYTANKYGRSLNLVNVSVKSPRRKRAFSVEYEYSDDPRNNVTYKTLTGSLVTFKNVDLKFTDNKPKDNLTEYKVINKSNTLINYAYQQNPGSKSVTLTAIRYRPAANQLTNFSIPTNETNALYAQALNILTSSFIGLNGLNYYLSNLSFNVNNENKIELTAGINYTKKKYV